MREEMDALMSATLENEQVKKAMRLQIATQLLAGSNVLELTAANQDDRVRTALNVAEKLMRQALA